MCQTPAGRDDCGDAAACRFHPSHSDPQEVLAAVPRFACEVCRFDPAAFQVLLESCRHVQYRYRMPMQDRCQCVRADWGSEKRSILAFKAQNPAFVPSFLSNHLPMFPFSGQTFFCLPGVEILGFVTPYASLCRQRRLRNRPGRRFGGRANPPRSRAVATVVSCLHCRNLVTYTLLIRSCSEKSYARPGSSEASHRPVWLALPT